MPNRAAGPLRLWTIQPWRVWRALRARGALAVDPRRCAGLHHAYEWLRGQLERRVPRWGGAYPWWAYCGGPDLRAARWSFARGEPRALLELEVPPEEAVLLPFLAWDGIFYGRYLGPRGEAKAWHRRLERAVDPGAWPIPEPWRAELEASWERIFDESAMAALLGRRRPRRGMSGCGRSWSTHEAVLGRLEAAWVRRVTRFTGAGRR